MDVSTFGITLLYFLVPGELEYLLSMAQGKGNMALYGVYDAIRKKRNMAYSSLVISTVASLNKSYLRECMFILLISSVAYVNTCNKWKSVINVKYETP